MMNKQVFAVVFWVFLGAARNIVANDGRAPVYNQNLTEVIADTKQAFIQYKITNTTQVDNLLKGFATLKVTGIRVPLFANDSFANKNMLDYLITQAKANGFKVFANPTNSGGGKNVACGVIPGAGTSDCSVKDDEAATQRLIDRVKAFTAEHAITWIDPFNEDGRATNSTWRVSQINTIYSSLVGNVNGAMIVGPCTWGLPAGIDMLDNTDILKYVKVATTHNLGFNHGQWPDFMAKAGKLPVWDSEATNNDVDGKGSRLIAAIDAGVNGVVLYNVWSNVSLTNGSVNAGGLAMQSLYLSPETNIAVKKALPGYALRLNNRTLLVEPTDDRKVSVEVYNSLGVRIKPTGNYTVNLQQAGIYLVKTTVNGVVHVEKVMAQ